MAVLNNCKSTQRLKTELTLAPIQFKSYFLKDSNGGFKYMHIFNVSTSIAISWLGC